MCFCIDGYASEKLPDKLVEYGKKLGCAPKSEKPFAWGVIKGGKSEDSAAFWCESEKERGVPNIASIAIYVRPDSKLNFKCPKLIPFQHIGAFFQVWQAGVDGKSSETLNQIYYLDSGKPGPKSVNANGYFLENVISDGASGASFYCYGNKWMKRDYH